MPYGYAGLICDRAQYGPKPAARGVGVLLVATYDSRADLATGFITRMLNIIETMLVADAHAALNYFASRLERAGWFQLWRDGDGMTRCMVSWLMVLRRTVFDLLAIYRLSTASRINWLILAYNTPLTMNDTLLLEFRVSPVAGPNGRLAPDAAFGEATGVAAQELLARHSNV